MNTLTNNEILEKLDLAEKKVIEKNNIENVNDLLKEILNVFQLYEDNQKILLDKIQEYSLVSEDGNKNIYVDEMIIDDYSYMGCFEDTGNLENTGIMNFSDCKQNAIDLGKPFFSLKVDNKNTNCYLGDNIGSLISNGEAYYEDVVWKSYVEESMVQSVKDPILKVFGSAFAVLNYDNKILFTNNYNYVSKAIKNNYNNGKLSSNDNCILILTNKGELKLINTSMGRRRRRRGMMRNLYRTNVKMQQVISKPSWLPINDPSCKYKSSYMRPGQFINVNETVNSSMGKFIMKLGNDGILRIIKSKSKCSSNPKVGSDTGNAIYMLDKTFYNINKNKINTSKTLDDGVFFNITQGECIDKCDNNNNCKAVNYKSTSRGSKCTLKDSITNNLTNNRHTVYEKRDTSYFDFKNDLGKVGYLDVEGNIFEYDNNLLDYKNEYRFYENSKSNGNIIQEGRGGGANLAMEKCNETSNCRGFLLDKRDNSYKLMDDSMYPKSNKQYDSNIDTYSKILEIDNNKTCPKSITNITPETWNSFNLVNKKQNLDDKCGVYKLVDSDLKIINYLEEKIRKSMDLLSQKINDYSVFDTSSGNELLKTYNVILNKLNMSFNNSKIKEGFINIDTCKFNRNHLIIATAAVLLIGLYLIH